MPDQRLEDTKREETSSEDAVDPGRWMQLKRWLAAHHLTMMTLPDTPRSIALGAAIGMFFGCTPLLGMKTLLSILVTWICRGNKIAAVISVTLHDLILPFSPAIYLWEYKMGMWALHGRIPQRPGISSRGAPRLYGMDDVFYRGSAASGRDRSFSRCPRRSSSILVCAEC